MPTSSARETVRELLAGAVQELAREGFLAAGAGEIPVSIERTKRPEHGDFASNVALTLAKPAGKPPRAVAEAIVARLTAADPGRRSPRRTSPVPASSTCGWRPRSGRRRSARCWRRATIGDGRRRSRRRASFWSTCRRTRPGPMTVAHGRVAAVGDALARLMRFAGYDLTTEFYINDAGNQVQTLALSDLGPLHGGRARGRSGRPRGGVPGERLQGRLHPRVRARRCTRATARGGSARRRPPTWKRSRTSRSTRRWG